MALNRRTVTVTWASLVLFLFAAVVKAAPQDLKELDKTVFDALAAKSTSTVNITLDGNLLKMASGFLSSSDDPDSAKIKRIVAGLKSITVRSFEFKKKGDYSEADLQAIRKQIKAAAWTRIVDAHNKEEGDSAEMYVLAGKDKPEGLFIIAAAVTELTVVHIMGAIDPKDLSALEDLGVPDLSRGHAEKRDK